MHGCVRRGGGDTDLGALGSGHTKKYSQRKMYAFAPRQIPFPFLLLLV